MPRKHDAHKDDLEGVAQRLRSERPVASPLDLDRIKTTAMSRAKAGTRRGGASARRLATAGLTVGLLAAGTGGVIAGGLNDHHAGNAATAQYGSTCVAGNNDGNGGSGGEGGSGGKGGSANGGSGGKAAIAFGHEQNGGSGGTGGAGGAGGTGGAGGSGGAGGAGGAGGNENGDFNCNENSFNTENITNNYNGTTTVNNYYVSPVTVTTATTPASGVLASTTTKTAAKTGKIKIHVRIPRKGKVKKVTLRLNGKRYAVISGKKASSNINLTNLPCGTEKLQITVTLTSGKTITQTHTYKLC
jgi:hypothetical protein